MTTMKNRQHDIKYGKVLGENIKRYREAALMSKFKFAVEARLDMRQLNNLEAGQSNPELETLQRISDALNIPLSVLFGEPPEPLTCFPLALYQKSFNKLDIRAQSQALAVLRLLCDPDLTDND